MVLTSNTVLFQECNVQKLRQRAAQYQLVQRDLIQKGPRTITTDQLQTGFEHDFRRSNTI